MFVKRKIVGEIYLCKITNEFSKNVSIKNVTMLSTDNLTNDWKNNFWEITLGIDYSIKNQKSWDFEQNLQNLRFYDFFTSTCDIQCLKGEQNSFVN